MRNEFKRAIELIMDKKPEEAKAIIKESIHSDDRYKIYKRQLKEYGFTFETYDVDDKIYDDIRKIVDNFPVPVQLEILDILWKEINHENA